MIKRTFYHFMKKKKKRKELILILVATTHHNIIKKIQRIRCSVCAYRTRLKVKTLDSGALPEITVCEHSSPCNVEERNRPACYQQTVVSVTIHFRVSTHSPSGHTWCSQLSLITQPPYKHSLFTQCQIVFASCLTFQH